MKRLILITSLIFFFNTTFTQYYIKDLTTKQSVEFAAIFNKSSQTGTYSDIDGSFSLKAKPNDTIIISCLGYYNDTVIYSSTIDKNWFLTSRSYDITEVTINSNLKYKTHELGYRKQKNKITFYSHIGSEWVAFIANEITSKSIIDAVILKTSSKSKKNIAYRIHIYVKDSISGLPGNEIANLPIFNSSTHKGDKYNLNNNIIFPKNGVYVGIEWISYLNIDGNKSLEGENITLSVPLTFSISDQNTLFRSKFYDNKWIFANETHPLSKLRNSINPPNLAISIIIKEILNE